MGLWTRKFRVAVAGALWAFRDQNSFHVHGVVTAMVLAVATWLRVPLISWALLVLAIGLVLTAELLNSAVELLVRVLHPARDPRIGRALDVAAGGVLVASITAAVLGLLVLGPPLWDALQPAATGR